MLTQVVRTSKNFLTYGNLLNHGVDGMTSLWGRRTNVLLLLNPRWCRGSRWVALSQLVTVSSKVPKMPVVEAWVAQPCSPWRSRWSRLLSVDQRTRSYLLRCTVAHLLRWRRTTWLVYRRSVHQAVLGWSATRRSWSGPLTPLLLLRGTYGILQPNGSTHELVEGLALEGHKVLTDLCALPLAEQGHLLHIHVNVVWAILHKVYEPLAVLVHGVGPLLKVQELLLPAVHEDARNVVPKESFAELSPWHLLAIRKGGSEGRPLGTRGPVELLGHDQSSGSSSSGEDWT
jgi:hypothetical protein